ISTRCVSSPAPTNSPCSPMAVRSSREPATPDSHAVCMRVTLGRHSKGKSVAAVNTGDESANWKPVELSERYTILDLLRGIALFGVLLVNLLYFFRLSLF